LLAALWPPHASADDFTLGSKKFTESVILAEMAAQLARDAGVATTHRRQIGGTRLLWEALKAGQIDAYPEYTGTIAQEIFAGRVAPDLAALQAALASEGVGMTRPLGFNNTYAIGVNPALAARLGLRTISDLAGHESLRFGFSEEFLDRADGWKALRGRYGLAHANVRGLDHDLAYRGLAAGDIDATDVYTTDAEIAYYGLAVLDDDRGHFPAYQAVFLYRDDLNRRAPAAVAALRRLERRIDAAAMARMNAAAKLERVAEDRVAANFVADRLGVAATVEDTGIATRVWRRTVEHLRLVAVSLAAAILVAVPLGIVAARRPRMGQALLAAVGVIQTIPSLAILVFMIPLLGIGGPPAIVALFLYSLLPIVRNTYAGLHDVPPSLRESADAMGLNPGARLRLVELPLAARSILAGIKTAAVINVGTATLGALIGAGGYGQPILTGIRLDDVGLILEGAVPAAVLALLVQGMFEVAERRIIPRGLRVRAG
ncbi:MAG: glycine betaine ABC transporter substrate-binding protein, partial [Rhodospirillaceae bacterium]